MSVSGQSVFDVLCHGWVQRAIKLGSVLLQRTNLLAERLKQETGT